MKERRKSCRCIYGEGNKVLLMLACNCHIYFWRPHLTLSPNPDDFKICILFTEINLMQQSTQVGKTYASVCGASIFSFWNTQASILIWSVSAAIQKQTSHCSPHPTLAHFQSEWALLAYDQHMPLNQIIKKPQWQNPRWLQQKKLLLKKCY